ncbi:MAG: hypothetical protein ABEI52_10780, partial [Halobacteriaceae archaeon]
MRLPQTAQKLQTAETAQTTQTAPRSCALASEAARRIDALETQVRLLEMVCRAQQQLTERMLTLTAAHVDTTQHARVAGRDVEDGDGDEDDARSVGPVVAA